jgi:hypothetical protein
MWVAEKLDWKGLILVVMTGSETVDCVRSLPYLQEHRKAMSCARTVSANASPVSHSSTYSWYIEVHVKKDSQATMQHMLC